MIFVSLFFTAGGVFYDIDLQYIFSFQTQGLRLSHKSLNTDTQPQLLLVV